MSEAEEFHVAHGSSCDEMRIRDSWIINYPKFSDARLAPRGPTRTSIAYEISIFQKSRLDFWFHTWFQWFHDFTRDFWFRPWFQISSAISWFHSWFLCFCWRFLELYYLSQWFGASTGDFTWLARFQPTVNDLWNAVNIPSRRTRSSAFTSSISGVFSVITVLGCYNSSRN